jgi:hypothetical protein
MASVPPDPYAAVAPCRGWELDVRTGWRATGSTPLVGHRQSPRNGRRLGDRLERWSFAP